ncbi:MAG: hypothetical protein R3F33_18045 [Planctomycetota bacterium]
MANHGKAALRGGWANGAVGMFVSGAFLVGSFAGRFAWAQGAGAEVAPPKVVQARSFEVVDAGGTVVARLGSNPHGGTLELFRDIGKDKPERCAWLGCTFSGGSEFQLSDPTAFSEALLRFGVYGKPAMPFLAADSCNGKPMLAVGGIDPEAPVLRLMRRDTGEVYWEK